MQCGGMDKLLAFSTTSYFNLENNIEMLCGLLVLSCKSL